MNVQLLSIPYNSNLTLFKFWLKFQSLGFWIFLNNAFGRIVSVLKDKDIISM